MEEMVTIKLRNSFGGSFDTFFTMLSQKTSRKNKFFDLPGFFFNDKNKEGRLKQTTKVNFAQS